MTRISTRPCCIFRRYKLTELIENYSRSLFSRPLVSFYQNMFRWFSDHWNYIHKSTSDNQKNHLVQKASKKYDRNYTRTHSPGVAWRLSDYNELYRLAFHYYYN